MSVIGFCLYTYQIFWKKEKVLSFFNMMSLTLTISVMLLFYGYSIETCSFISCVKDGIYGILCLSILIGFFIVWFHSLEERKEDFLILYRLGVKKSILVLTVQVEAMIFQIISSIVAILCMLLFVYFVGQYEIKVLLAGVVRIHIELQLILLVIASIYIKK